MYYNIIISQWQGEHNMLTLGNIITEIIYKIGSIFTIICQIISVLFLIYSILLTVLILS